MIEAKIFADWRPEHGQLWSKVPLKLKHRLHAHPLFQDDALARLIETYPREHYQLMQPAQTPGGCSRDGELAGISGEEAIAAIAKGRMWINMRNVAEVDTRYDALMRQIFAEIEDNVPGFTTLSQTIGILVSSPKSQTHYHADLPGQSLFQIRGRKRLYLYQPVEPFISRRQIERITISRKEFITYEPWYDDHAQKIDLEPGDMMHWPLNAPHRVDNADCLNVSMTMEFFTPEIRRKHIVNRANGILRILDMEPKSAATSGASYYVKAVLQRALRGTPIVKRQDEMVVRRPTFRLDPARPDGIADLE
jgi:hypothetical protein